jgi:hypothetical protein
MDAKIRLSQEEASLVVNGDWILTKNGVMQKAMTMLGLVQTEQKIFLDAFQSKLPQAVYQTSPKISRGENYEGLPWLILDYPRAFEKEDSFAIRTFFWWGHFFSVTLHLSGIYKKMYEATITNAFENLKNAGFHICIGADQWQHHFGKDNYAAIDQLDFATWAATVGNKDFIKLSKKIPLDEWDEAPNKLMEVFRELVMTLMDQLPRR